MAVCGCPSAHTGRLWLSISTHISTLVLGLSTVALPVDYSGDFGPRGLSVQYTQDIRGCSSAHTRHLCVSVSTHKMSVAVHPYTYQHVGPWTQHADPSRGLFGTSVAVCVFPSVSISTHRTSVAVHQYTYQHVGLWTQHAGPSHGLFGLSVQCTQDVRGCPFVSMAVLGQHTHDQRQDARGCPSAHTGRLCGSVSTHMTSVAVCVCPPAHTGRPLLFVAVCQHTQDVRDCPCVSVSTHMTSVAVHQYTYQHYTQDVRGCPPAHTGRQWLSVAVRSCPCVSVCVRQHTQDVCGCPSVHISARWTSVGVRQHKQNVRVCPSAHTGRPWLSGCVCVCPSAHTGHPWLSISTHISTLVLGLSTLTLPVDCSGDFGPRGLSVQYTQRLECPSLQEFLRLAEPRPRSHDPGQRPVQKKTGTRCQLEPVPSRLVDELVSLGMRGDQQHKPAL
ncbi:hypothetical protein YC2023_066293 [Brassica napus]